MSANDRIQWFHKMVSERCYPNSRDISEKFGISPLIIKGRQPTREAETHARATMRKPSLAYKLLLHFLVISLKVTPTASEMSAVIRNAEKHFSLYIRATIMGSRRISEIASRSLPVMLKTIFLFITFCLLLRQLYPKGRTEHDLPQ